MIPATILALLACGAVSDEFRERLEQLGAPRADARAAAERWLQANLVIERYPELAEAALAGDAEVRGRLARVLSSDGRHLMLALELCAEKDASLRALGREAVRAGVARSDPRLGEPALRGEGLELLLRRTASASPPRRLRLDARRSLEQMVEELELLGELPLGLTLDPRVATKTIRRAEGPLSGPWDELLWRISRAMGVEIELHGLGDPRASVSPAGAFLRLTAEPDAPRSGVDVISEWLFVLAQAGDEASRTRAARSLGACGFDPALAWMDHRLRTRADPAALEGLLGAAARGRVEQALLTPGVLEPLLAQAEAQGGARSARILCALARSGCSDEGGEALVPRLLAGFATASPRARWARLFVLERNGCAAAELEELARALLAAPEAAPALRLQALHALAACARAAPGPLRVEGLAELFRLELDEVERERLGRALALLALAPPHRDPAGIPAEWGPRERLRLVEAWLWSGAPEAVAAHVAAWMRVPAAESATRGEVLAEELWPWRARGGGPLVDGALRAAQALAPAQTGALERVRLLLGLVPAQEVAGVLARGRYALDGPEADLALLGALAGYSAEIEEESAARDTLHTFLNAALQSNRRHEECAALIGALERVTRGLYAAGRDESGALFARFVSQALLRKRQTELGQFFERLAWPPDAFYEVWDVSRALARCEVPPSL